MIYKPRHFALDELACPHVFKKYGQVAWSFFDERILMVLDFIRDQLGPVYVNNYDLTPELRKKAGLPLFDERGIRCLHCDIVKSAIKKDVLYYSAHMRAQAFDFNVAGKTYDKVNLWVIDNAARLPFPIRLEKNTRGWTHIDVCNSGKSPYKVELFNANI